MKVPLGDIRPVILLAYMSYSRHVAQPPCAVTASGDAGYTSSLVLCVVSGGFDSCVSCLQFAVGLRIVSSFLRLQTLWSPSGDGSYSSPSSHTSYCPVCESEAWMFSAAVLSMATCTVHVLRVSATFWINKLEARRSTETCLCGCVLLVFNIHSVFSLFICNLRYLEINPHWNVLLVLLTRSMARM